jgi:hypothetical protein
MPAVRRHRTGYVTALAIVVLVVPLGALVAPGSSGRGKQPPNVADLLERVPLLFEANRGQHDPEVRFTARAPGHHVVLTDEGLFVSNPDAAGSRLGILFDGARPDPVVAGERPTAARSNQLLGNDPSRWRTDIPTFGAVSYRDVYPGVDLVVYGRGGQVEHDFIVAPGVDPGVIRLAMSGTAGGHIDKSGDLVLPLDTGEVRLLAPTLYQEVDGRRRPVKGGFQYRADGKVGFQVGAYDRSRPLVIDPVVVSASYLGGTSTETAYAVALDVDGNVAITGYTESSDFPTLSPAQPNLTQSEGARTDVFVTKVKADGSTVLWSTYLGGRGREAALAVAVGGDGGVYLTGYTESADFPLNKAIQNANAGGANDAFVAKLNSAGSALEYSTFLGGKGAETGNGIAVDGAGAAYVVGHTGSSDFPTVRPFQAALARPDDLDGFVTKVQAGGTGLAYSSYLGGGGDDHLTDVAIDGEGNAYAVGDTRAGDFPTVRPFQPALGAAAAGGSFADAVVAKVKTDGSGLAYGSFLGGTESDKATAVAVDATGNAYITGNTGSPNFPVLSAFQPKKDGDFDAFVTKLKTDGNLAYSSFLGGSGSDGGEAVAVDRQGHAFVSGATASANFPAVKPFQGAKGGGFVDAFVTEVNTSGSSLVSSSYLGGRDDDQAAGLAVDRDGNLAVVGYTDSADFPIAKPFQPQKAGGVGDAFVVKIQAEGVAGGSSGGSAVSKRERRVRTLVTITGGLLIAAALQTLWLRRKPEPKGQPEPTPTGRDVEVPGLAYTPRRRRPVVPGRAGVPESHVPSGSANWDRRVPIGVPSGDGGEPDEEWEPVRPKRRRPAPAWDEPQRPVLRPLERPAEPAGIPKMAAPDLWGTDAPLAEAAASVRAGRPAPSEPAVVEDHREELSETDRWPLEPAAARSTVAELDPLDVWGPLVVEQDPDQWADEWGVTALLESGPQAAEVAQAEPLAGRAMDEGAVSEGTVTEDTVAEDMVAGEAVAREAERTEREAAEAAELAAAAERAALEAAVAEAAARKSAELAEREAARPATPDAAEVWGPAAMEQAEAESALTGEQAASEAVEQVEAGAQPPISDLTAPERAAVEAANLEAIARARAQAARAAHAAHMAAQAEAAEAARAAEAAQAEARAASQAAALQAALAASEAAEAEAARVAEADAARLAAQVAAQVAEANAARVAAQAAATAQAEEEAVPRAPAQLEAERLAAAAAEAAARAQAEAAARAAAAAGPPPEAESTGQPTPGEDGWLPEPPETEVRPADRAVAAGAEQEAPGVATPREPDEEWSPEAQPAEARPAEAREAEVRPAEVQPSDVRAAEVRTGDVRAAAVRAAEVRAAEVRAAQAREEADARASLAREAEARAAQARAAEARARKEGPPAPPRPPVAPGSRDLSLSELLDEDLPIPEPLRSGQADRPVAEGRRSGGSSPWIDQVLDEDLPGATGPQPVAPPPTPSGLVGGSPGSAAGAPDDEAGEDYLPPPPPRLLTNLFEPDPDDPLVQSTQSRKGKRRKEP